MGSGRSFYLEAQMRFFMKTIFLAAALFPVVSLMALEEGESFVAGSYADEKWRNKHQWKGRNQGGWRHANWYGGIDENEPNDELNVWYYGNYEWFPPPPPPPLEEESEEEEFEEGEESTEVPS